MVVGIRGALGAYAPPLSRECTPLTSWIRHRLHAADRWINFTQYIDNAESKWRSSRMVSTFHTEHACPPHYAVNPGHLQNFKDLHPRRAQHPGVGSVSGFSWYNLQTTNEASSAPNSNVQILPFTNDHSLMVDRKWCGILQSTSQFNGCH